MNVPNKITLSRLILIPIIVLIKIFPYGQFGISLPIFRVGTVDLSLINIILLFLFIVGSLSDFVDGYLARKNNLVTTFGKFVDPIADKALTTTLFILFAVDGTIPVVIAIVMIWRDLIVDGLRMLAAEKGTVVAANIYGKLKTVFQMVAIILVLANNLPFELWNIPVADIVLWLATFMSVTSGVTYYMELRPYVMESK